MILLLIHIVLLAIFIVATAFEGVFLIPAGSFAGIALLLQSPNPSIVIKLGFAVAELACLCLFIIGLKHRASLGGRMLNVASVYLWCLFGYVSLGFLNG